MNKDDSFYLHHIIDAIDQATSYIEGMNIDNFLKNRLVQDGVIRQMEIIGEATKQLSPTLREQNPLVPWKDLAGMRDKLIHYYFGVDIDTVWLTATEDLPDLRYEVTKVINNISKDD